MIQLVDAISVKSKKKKSQCLFLHFDLLIKWFIQSFGMSDSDLLTQISNRQVNDLKNDFLAVFTQANKSQYINSMLIERLKTH